ncbi:MAG: protein adenylyltransferase SelO [Ferruginibacter sp.]
MDKQKLSVIAFKNEFVNTFEGDNSGILMPRQTPGVLYAKALPTPVKKVTLLAWSEDLADELGIDTPSIGNTEEGQADIDILGGNLVTPSMEPYAACYAGHQFGHWAGQLGDGRAITLGELQIPTGKTYELQLKGPGLTPYSRTADGRAVLRSSVREYLMSEAMHYLGVPTTRALSLVTTGENVLRDMFYDGNPRYEPGAIVMRVAPGFLRFGNYQILAAREEISNLRQLVDWTIERYYPHIDADNRILKWYKEVLDRTAALIIEWLRVGFVHGVMNTDNMSILGLTIDYGPYSFLDDFDVNFTPNTTDLPGRRYAFGRQAAIAKWNLACLAGAIAPLLEDHTQLQAALDAYDDVYWQGYYKMMANKLGLDEVRETDAYLIERFEGMLKKIKPDMTIFFQLIIQFADEGPATNFAGHFEESFYSTPAEEDIELLNNLMNDYGSRIISNTISRENAVEIMRKSNPRFILRNYLLHQAIVELEKGSNTLFAKLQQAMKDPYSHSFDEFFVKRPEWATSTAGCSTLSCSS